MFLLFGVVVAAVATTGLGATRVAQAAPSFVQARAREITSGTTNSLAFSSANTSGNLIVAYVVWSDAPTVTLTDSRGNTYASAQPVTRWNGSQWSAQVFYAKNVAGGANTVTAQFSSNINSFGILYIHEYSGIDQNNPLDVSRSAIGSSSAMNSGSATTTNANDLIFGAGASAKRVTGAGTGFTTRSTAFDNRTMDRIVTTAGSYNVTANQNSNAWVLQMVAFKARPTDTKPPTTPSGLAATPDSVSRVNLSWNPSSDDVGVTGYRISRNGSQVGTSVTPSFSDSGLTPNTTYSYTVSAVDAAGNASPPSTAVSATTLADTTAPSVPTNLAATVVSPTQVNLSWSASSDDVAVTGYDVFRDGINRTTVGSTTYNDTGLTPGQTYSYTVRSRDAAGNSSVQTVAVSATTPAPDTTPPATDITAPAPDATLSGTVVVSAAATDDVGVAGVQFLLDGLPLNSEDTTAPFSTSWDTTTAGNGPHVLTSRARDGAGNTTTSSGRNVTVANTVPPPSSGPTASYAMNEGSGTSTADASGHGISGTLVNGATWADGKFDRAVRLDGANDYVELGNPTALRITDSMTISAWINSAAFPGDDAAIVSKRGGAVGFQLDTTMDRGPRTIGFKLTTSSGGAMFRYGATAMQLDTWYHVAGVYNAATRTLDVYLNGQLDNAHLEGIISATQQDSPLGVSIGRRPGNAGFEFNGRIDDVRIYNRALTPAEIHADMNTPIAGGPPTDPVPPAVSITAPLASAQVADIVNVTADATDDVGVAGVRFYVDGVASGVEDDSAPYALAWDTRTAGNGAHTLTARARDVSGNETTSAPVTVNVANSNLFQNEVLATGLNLPTALKFLPDGRLLVAELAGRIRVLPAPYTTPAATPFLQLTNVGSAGVQQGIYDFALDPGFATNRYFYVFYTLGTPNRDRLSRFTANATLTGTVAGSELVLYQDPVDAHAEHHGGAITFGNDGKLYFTTGEHFSPGEAQSLASPRGKIHRINLDGTVPADNPFVDGTGPNWDSIWAYGLRNPFRAYFDGPTGRLLVADVGGNDYSVAKEEVNVGARGANYGWPNNEGACSSPCTSPLYSYPHNGRDASITGGFVYHGTQYPAAYQGSYFFADYTQNWIRRLTFDAAGNVTGVHNFEPADGSVDGPYGDIVYLTEGPDGAIYYLDLGYSDISGQFGVSRVRRIRFVQANQSPVAVSAATPTSGPTPLAVTFSSAGSSDPEGQPVTYAWDFGDGATSTEANPTHTYTGPGQYTARLLVSDGVNTTAALPLTISAGGRPVATIATPTDGSSFRAGDVISFSGSGTDPDDGTLPPSAFTWNIDFLHEGHTHPGTPVAGVASGTFAIPTTGHDFSGNTRYRITLTVRDSNGLTDSKSVVVVPSKVSLTFQTVPAGAALYLDGIARTTPFVYDTLVGFQHTVEARNQTSGGNNYTFTSWSDGGAQTHAVVVPPAAQTYTATYAVTPAPSGPIGFVQQNFATPQTPQTSQAVSYTSPQLAGNLNVVVVGFDNVTSNVTSVIDSTGNVYAVAAPLTRSGNNSQAVYYAKDIAGGANTVTVTFDAPTPYVDVRVAEYSGLDRSNPLDVTASAVGSTQPASSGPATTTSSNTLLVGAGTTTGGFNGPGSGYTLRVITQPDLDILEDRIVQAAGTYAATATGNGTWVLQLVAFRGAS